MQAHLNLIRKQFEQDRYAKSGVTKNGHFSYYILTGKRHRWIQNPPLWQRGARGDFFMRPRRQNGSKNRGRLFAYFGRPKFQPWRRVKCQPNSFDKTGRG